MIKKKLNKNFWKWFKDSKVIDKNNEPLIVYHGTTSKFDSFDILKAGKSSTSAGVGFWFSPLEEFGKNFANQTWYGDKESKVLSVYLSIKNPKIYISDNSDNSKIEELNIELNKIKKKIEELIALYGWNSLMLGNINIEEYNFFKDNKFTKGIKEEIILAKKTYDLLKNEYNIKESEKYKLLFSDSYEKFKTDIYEIEGKNAYIANVGGLGMTLDTPKETIYAYRKKLISEGYDGIFIINTRFDASVAGGINTQYCAFFPNQIKSINNNGNWSLLSNNIKEDEEDGEPTMSITHLKSRIKWLAKLAQKVYDDWEEDDIDIYAGGGICHLIADAFADYLNFHGIETQTISSNFEQHVYCISKVKEGIYSVDIHWSYYETGGGYNWKKIPNVVFDGSEIEFFQISPFYQDWEEYTNEI